MRWVFRTLAALVLLALPASAQDPRRVALVIANAEYAPPASILANPVNDSRVVAAALRAAGFQTVDVKLNLDFADFRNALREFRDKAQGAEAAVIYYAGHGIEGNGNNWLIPTDAALAAEADLVYEAVNLDLALSALAGADLRVVILDACRNNPFGRRWSGTRAVTRGLTAIDVDDVLVIYAAAPGQTASDGAGGNSPFATALARRLPQPGLPIQMLGGLVRDDVVRATGGGAQAQRPYYGGSITGEAFYLVPAVAPVAAQAAPLSPCAPFDERWIGGLKASSDRRALQMFVEAAPAQCISRDAAELRLASLTTTPASPTAPVVPRDARGTFRDCPTCPLMATVPAGSFTMGSPASEPGRSADEGPQRSVRIAAFAAAVHEVTFDEWDACVADGGCSSYQPDDAGWGRGKRPVIYISWIDAKKYVTWLTQETGKTYRLLTEAEWEYAARAGTTGRYATGASISTAQANFGNTLNTTTLVGSYAANAFGLHDMHGNVWEWVEDCKVHTYAGAPATGEAVVRENCASRVIRGGSWDDGDADARSANRESFVSARRGNEIGLRVARTP